MNADFRLEKNSDARAVPKRVAFVKGRTSARVRNEEEDMVMTVPHLVVREVIAFMLMVIVLALLSLFFNAPLEWIANPEHTPNPAKAPWYFLGLQELLHYFPPIVAGVVLPSLAVVALIVIPYFRVNVKRENLWEEDRRRKLILVLSVAGVLSIVLLAYNVYAMLIPTVIVTAVMVTPAFLRRSRGALGWLGSRPLSWWIMTWFVIMVIVLTAIGTLFRGPEWSWTWPWKEIY
jgi:quinol-cytochrome oxidoreductase complex cytochrome b subunit